MPSATVPPHNTCEMCYVSTRANSEKTLKDCVVDNWELLSARLLPWKRKAGAASGSYQ